MLQRISTRLYFLPLKVWVYTVRDSEAISSQVVFQTIPLKTEYFYRVLQAEKQSYNLLTSIILTTTTSPSLQTPPPSTQPASLVLHMGCEKICSLFPCYESLSNCRHFEEGLQKGME